MTWLKLCTEGRNTQPWETPWRTGEGLDFVFNAEVMTVREVDDEPVECSALDPHWLLTVADDGVINSVKGGGEVEEEEGYWTRIGKEEIIRYFEEGCFSTAVLAESSLK